MYSAVIMMALAGSADVPAFGHRGRGGSCGGYSSGCCGSYYGGGYGCYGGYGGYGCYGGYGGYGCYGGYAGYGCYGGGYGGYGCYGVSYGGDYGVYSGFAGGYGCYCGSGVIVDGSGVMPSAGQPGVTGGDQGTPQTTEEPQTPEEEKWFKELRKKATTPQQREDLEKAWKGAGHKERREYYQQNKGGPGTTGKGDKGGEEESMNQAGEPGRILVRLPEDAKVTVDGHPTLSTSALRLYITPPLRPGMEYYYTFRAEISRNGQPRIATRQVAVHAAGQTEVNLSDFSTVDSVARK